MVHLKYGRSLLIGGSSFSPEIQGRKVVVKGRGEQEWQLRPVWGLLVRFFFFFSSGLISWSSMVRVYDEGGTRETEGCPSRGDIASRETYTLKKL